MRIPDDYLKCTVFLCVDTGKGYEAGGTGYLVSVPSDVTGFIYVYLVTAKHCVIEAREKYGDIFVRVNRRGGDMQHIKISEDIPWEYPSDTSVDLAVLPIQMDRQYLDVKSIDYTAIATDQAIEEHGIGIGDEVFISGLFTKHYGNKRNIPIVRSGIIAAMPDEPIPDKKTGLSYHAILD